MGSSMPSILHNKAIVLAVESQDRSRAAYPLPDYDIVRDVFFVLTHDAVCVHRAIGRLVDSGWSAPGGALLRTLMDISVSAVAVNRAASPKLAAFRYLYSGLRRHSRDVGLPAKARRAMFQQIRQRLALLAPADRTLAAAVVKDRDRPYWFAPEWKGPSEVIELYSDPEMKWVYLQASAAAHATFLGARLFRDDPDKMDINPRDVGPRAVSLELASCRWLAEIVRVRNTSEQLGLEEQIDGLVSEIREAVARIPRAAT